MAKKDRTRIEYLPCQAAYDELAGAMYPNRRPHALIDKLVIAGLAAAKPHHCWLKDKTGTGSRR